MTRITTLVILIIFIVSCNSNQESPTLKQKTVVQEGAQQMLERISKDVSNEGPIAWLKYFESSTDFFMASDGQLVFENNNSATDFINNTLVKSISKIELRWSNIRIDPLTSNLANIASTFHEDITDWTGNKVPTAGYFTAIAQQTSQGWKLRNAHWSIKAIH